LKNLKKPKFSVLYISYDGLLEPLGESQVLSYIEPLSKQFKIDVISFEKPSDLKSKRQEDLDKKLKNQGIRWHYLKYHSKPSVISTLFDIFKGFCTCLVILIRNKKRIVHIRSLVPGIIVLPLKKVFRFKLIFDMRGFWPDEKADRAGWLRSGYRFLLSENLQSRLITNSDKIVTLTHQAKKRILKDFPNLRDSVLEVIPTCTDLDKFKLSNHQIQITDEFTFGHLGSVDTAYNIDPILNMVRNFQEIGKKVKIIFFNKDSHEYIRSRINKYNLLEGSFEIKAVEFSSISDHLKEIDLGCFFANYSISIKGSLPTKIGEFLSSGKPVICNPANEDIAEIIDKNEVGIIKRLESDYSPEDLFYSLEELMSKKDIRVRCRELAKKLFSLNLGVESYRKIYLDLGAE
tara:strand:+ start:37055 stop:38266 length:1212 start_codon:yes stop_codon:yes gene_type:complete